MAKPIFKGFGAIKALENYYSGVRKSKDFENLEGGLRVRDDLNIGELQSHLKNLSQLPTVTGITQQTSVMSAKQAKYLETKAKLLKDLVANRKQSMSQLVDMVKSTTQHQQNEMNAVEQIINERAKHAEMLGWHNYSNVTQQAEVDGFDKALAEMTQKIKQRRG